MKNHKKLMRWALGLGFVAAVIIAIAFVQSERQVKNHEVALECPDEKIVNRMPGPGSSGSEYYIKNGERKEISDYDAAWVSANCNVPVQEVF